MGKSVNRRAAPSSAASSEAERDFDSTNYSSVDESPAKSKSPVKALAKLIPKKKKKALEISGPIINENTPIPKGAIPLGKWKSDDEENETPSPRRPLPQRANSKGSSGSRSRSRSRGPERRTNKNSDVDSLSLDSDSQDENPKRAPPTQQMKRQQQTPRKQLDNDSDDSPKASPQSKTSPRAKQATSKSSSAKKGARPILSDNSDSSDSDDVTSPISPASNHDAPPSKWQAKDKHAKYQPVAAEALHDKKKKPSRISESDDDSDTPLSPLSNKGPKRSSSPSTGPRRRPSKDIKSPTRGITATAVAGSGNRGPPRAAILDFSSDENPSPAASDDNNDSDVDAPSPASKSSPLQKSSKAQKKLSALDSSRTAWASRKPGSGGGGVKTREVAGKSATSDDLGAGSDAMAKLEGKAGGARRGSAKRDSSDMEVWGDMEKKLEEKKAAVEKQKQKLKEQQELERQKEEERQQELEWMREEAERKEEQERQESLAQEKEKQRKLDREKQTAEALAFSLANSAPSSRETSPVSARSISKSRNPKSPLQQQQQLKPKYGAIVVQDRPESTASFETIMTQDDRAARARPPRGTEGLNRPPPPRGASIQPSQKSPVGAEPKRAHNPRHSSLSASSQMVNELNSMLQESTPAPLSIPGPAPVVKKFNWATANKLKEDAAAAQTSPVVAGKDQYLSPKTPKSPGFEKSQVVAVASDSDNDYSDVDDLPIKSPSKSNGRILPPKSKGSLREKSLPPPPVLTAKEKSMQSSKGAAKIIKPQQSKQLFAALERETEGIADDQALLSSHAPQLTGSSGADLKALFDDLDADASLWNLSKEHRRKSRAAFDRVASMAEQLKKSVVEDEMWRLLEEETDELNALFEEAAEKSKKGVVVSEEERLRRMEERVLRKLGKLQDKLAFIDERVAAVDEGIRKREMVDNPKAQPAVSLFGGLFGGSKKKESSEPSSPVPKDGGSPTVVRKNSVKSVNDEKTSVAGSPMSRNPSEKSTKENDADGEPASIDNPKSGFFQKLFGNKDQASSGASSPTSQGVSPGNPPSLAAAAGQNQETNANQASAPAPSNSNTNSKVVKSATSTSSLKKVVTIPGGQAQAAAIAAVNSSEISSSPLTAKHSISPQAASGSTPTASPIPAATTPAPNDAPQQPTPVNGEKKTVLGWLFGGKKKENGQEGVGNASSSGGTPTLEENANSPAMLKQSSSDGESISSRASAVERSAERRRKWAEMKAVEGGASPMPSLEERRQQWMAKKQGEEGSKVADERAARMAKRRADGEESGGQSPSVKREP